MWTDVPSSITMDYQGDIDEIHQYDVFILFGLRMSAEFQLYLLLQFPEERHIINKLRAESHLRTRITYKIKE